MTPEHIEQMTAAPGETRDTGSRWVCNRPLQPVRYEHYTTRKGDEVYELVSPLCPLEWKHDGPCRVEA